MQGIFFHANQNEKPVSIEIVQMLYIKKFTRI